VPLLRVAPVYLLGIIFTTEDFTWLSWTSFEIMDFFGPGFDPEDLTQYTINETYLIMENYNLLNGLYTMYMFDYIIANQDRHAENWELLMDDDTEPNYVLAPLYDNGSSLFSTIPYNSSKINGMLTDKNQFLGYNNRAKSMFSIEMNGNIQTRPKAIDILSYLYKQNPNLFVECYKKFEGIDYDVVYKSIEFIDSDLLEDSRKRLIGHLIVFRIQRINNLIMEGGDVNGE